MPHNKHKVYYTNLHYKIDPVSKAIVDQSSVKPKLMQFDHNSERRTFELPRYIGSHDMSLCNKVYIHYLNIDASTREENPGVYEVKDMQVSTEDENTLIFSWLISGAATKFAGVLSFLVSFICEAEDGEIQYQWDTDINNERTVVKGMNNAPVVLEKYLDIIEAWKKSFEQSMLEKTKAIVDEAIENAEFGGDISYNDLKDKPFGEEDAPENAVNIPFVASAYNFQIDPDAMAYRASEQTFTKDELLDKDVPFYVDIKVDGEVRPVSLSDLTAIDSTGYTVFTYDSYRKIYVVYDSNNQLDYWSGSAAAIGIYFSQGNTDNRVERLYREGKVVNMIDNKFLNLANHPVIKDILARLSAAKI